MQAEQMALQKLELALLKGGHDKNTKIRIKQGFANKKMKVLFCPATTVNSGPASLLTCM